MDRKFERDASILIIKGRILFHGYNVVLCPVTMPTPLITVDFLWNCYCVNLPVDGRAEWNDLADYALRGIYRMVTAK